MRGFGVGAVVGLLLAGCVVPGAHLQGFRVINETGAPVTVDLTLSEKMRGEDEFVTRFERQLEVNASSWASAWQKFSNGEYRLLATVASGTKNVTAELAPLRFGDVDLHNVDPDDDPRTIYVWWNGTALRLEGCPNAGCPIPATITRQA